MSVFFALIAKYSISTEKNVGYAYEFQKLIISVLSRLEFF